MPGWRAPSPEEISALVEEMAVEASLRLPADVRDALDRALREESGELARYALRMLLENADIASREGIPLCQDTGTFHLFVEVGRGTCAPPYLREAAEEGLRRATRRVPLRSSQVEDPLGERKNTGDNTPLRLHLESAGEREGMRFSLLAKGGGSENSTSLFMLLPGEGKEGLERVVLEAVRVKAASACPPVVVSVGVGGDAEGCLRLALKGLLRPLGERSPRPHLAELEEELLGKVNSLGIGAAGLGGKITALDLHLEEAPAHMAT
ncbi:MAG: fumarate hydratase, partial [Candidatus Geothermincolales bacterium]